MRIVVYEDLQCGDCAEFRQMLHAELLPKFGAHAHFAHRDFPLPKHSWARPAAIAARYFESVNEELGVTFRRATLDGRRSIAAETLADHVAAFARAHGADPAAAIAALADSALQAAVEADYQEGVARGVAKTPTVLVNDEAFVERFTVEAISKSIAEGL